MDGWTKLIVNNFNYWVHIVLMSMGLWAIITKNNIVKKIIGINIFQTSIYLLFISIGAKRSATLPIIINKLNQQTGQSDSNMMSAAVMAADYINPLPHAMMLTAIVVGVATVGVALALSNKVYRTYGTLEEDEILDQIRDHRNRGEEMENS